MKKSKIIALLIVIGAVIGIFVIILFNNRPYMQVSDVLANPPKYDGKNIQVIGIVAGFSGGNFNLTEGDDAIIIDTSIVVIPAGLVDGMEVVVEGLFNSSLILTANEILTQCS